MFINGVKFFFFSNTSTTLAPWQVAKLRNEQAI